MDFLRPFQNNNSFQQNYQSVAFQNNQPQIQFFVVNDIQEAQNIQVQFNTIYFIMNYKSKEIYTKQLNRDGLIDFDIYKNEKIIKENQKDNDLLQKINQKLDKIVNCVNQEDIKNNEVNNNE